MRIRSISFPALNLRESVRRAFPARLRKLRDDCRFCFRHGSRAIPCALGVARYGAGDDMGWLGALAPADASKPASLLKYAMKAGEGQPRAARTKAFLSTITDKNGPKKVFSAHCGLAMALAGQLGMPGGVITALGQMYERFDGKGQPNGLRGDEISLPARVLHVAWRAMVQTTMEGREAAIHEVSARSGGELDPNIAGAFARIADDLLP